MPDIVWSQALEGEQPDCVLGQDRVLMHYKAPGEQNDTQVLCFDLQGRKLWSRALQDNCPLQVGFARQLSAASLFECL
jgi:hypothetical protein